IRLRPGLTLAARRRCLSRRILSGRALLPPGCLPAGARVRGGLLHSALALAGGWRLAATLTLGLDPAGESQRGDRSRIDAAGRLEALLPLEGDQRLTSFRPEHAVDLRMQEASLNEDLLQVA